MDIQGLKRALAVVSGNLTLSDSSLPGSSLQDLLTDYNGSQPLTIEGAQVETSATAVTVTGSAAFLNVPKAPVVAVFTIDSAGNPQASIRFTMIGDQLPPSPWVFSKSFPLLVTPYGPVDTDTRQAGGATPKTPSLVPPLLDRLVLYPAAFVLNTSAEVDVKTGVALVPGLNFVATLHPQGTLGLFETVLGGKSQLTLHGIITAVRPTDHTPPLPPRSYQWQPTSWRLPGLSLQASLGVSVKLGKLSLSNPRYQIYCPPSMEWLEKNPTYLPAAVVTATLAVPSANLALDVTTLLSSGLLQVLGDFAGFDLAALEHLIDLAGGSDLTGSLPSDLQSIVKQVGGLSLVHVALDLSGLSPSDITNVTLSVGVPRANWTVFDGLTVESLIADFDVTAPFSAQRALSTTVRGTLNVAGTSFDVFTQVPSFSVNANLKSSVMLPLRGLFKTYLPELPAPPDLSVSQMEMIVTPGKSYVFSASLANTPAWTLDLGPTNLLFSDVQLSIQKTKGASATGSVSGTVQIGGLQLDGQYTLPGSFLLRAQLPDCKLSQLVGAFDQLGLTLPGGFDVDFSQAYVILSEGSGTASFAAAAAIDGFGLVAFVAEKQGAQTGVALGASLTNPKLSAIPGLGPLAPFDNLLAPQSLMLVVSSLTAPGFQFPDMANFQAPPLAGKHLRMPAQASGLTQGLNLYAELDTGKSKGFQALARFLGIELAGNLGMTLAVSLPDPESNSKLFISVKETVSGVTFNGELGLLMSGGEPGAFLSGAALATVQGQSLAFNLTSMVVPDGILISGSMSGGPIHFNPLPVQISNLGIVLGVDLEGVPSLGFMGTLDVKAFSSSVAVFLDSTDPARSLVAGSLSPTSLLEVVQSIAGQVTVPAPLDKVLALVRLKGLSAFNAPASLATALDARDLAAISTDFQQYGRVSLPATSSQVLLEVNVKGSLWHLTDLTTMTHYTLTLSGPSVVVTLDPQFYCAPEQTFIGAMQFPQGLHVLAGIDYYELIQAQIQLLVNPTVGISANAVLAPIVIYKPSFFSVTDATGQKGPSLSLATYGQPAATDPNLRSPHFMVTGSVEILSQKVTSVYLAATTSGIVFAASITPNPKLSLTLSGNLTSLSHLSITGSVSLGLQGSIDFGMLGSVSVDVSLASGSFALSWDGKTPSAKVTGSVTIPVVNQTFLLSITLDPDSATALEHLATAALSELQSLISAAFADVNVWLGWVDKGVVIGTSSAKQVGQILAKNFNMGGQAIAAATRSALRYTANEIALALSGAGVAADAAAVALRGVGCAATDVGDALHTVYGQTAEQAAVALKGAGYAINEVGDGLKNAYGASVSGIATAFKGAGYGVSDAGNYIKGAFGLAPSALNDALSGAGYAAGEIQGFFGNLGGDFGGFFQSVGNALNPSNW